MSKLVDVFRKLGILRYGKVSGTYKSTKDMPTELFMDNVYDKKKDLVTGEDIQKVKKAFSKDEKGIAMIFIVIAIGVLVIAGGTYFVIKNKAANKSAASKKAPAASQAQKNGAGSSNDESKRDDCRGMFDVVNISIKPDPRPEHDASVSYVSFEFDATPPIKLKCLTVISVYDKSGKLVKTSSTLEPIDFQSCGPSYLPHPCRTYPLVGLTDTPYQPGMTAKVVIE